jgi:hypothetical protein
MKYHIFKSNSANVTDDEDLVKILSSTEKTGGVTPNLARSILGDILNLELDPYDKDKIDFDPDIPLSVTLVDRAKVVAGNDQSGVLPPNQGQLPTSDKNNQESQTVANSQEDNVMKQLKGIVSILEKDIHKEIFYGIG